MSNRRVVVTGIGVVCPTGNDMKTAWNAVVEGKSGIDKITKFESEDIPVKIAGELKNFDPSSFISPKELKKMDEFIIYGIASSLQAWKDAGYNGSEHGLDPERIGVILSSGIGGFPYIEKTTQNYYNRGYRRISPFFIPAVIPNLAAGQVSIAINANGPNLCITTACAAGSHSIGEAAQKIMNDDADLMLAGASDGIICPTGVGGFAIMKALSTRNDEPQKASRPFDRDRDGFVIAEGSATLVLEEYEHAKKRNANIYAEIIGYGASGDAYHITAPDVSGKGAILAMKIALRKASKNSGISPENVGYVNTHGTSTPAGDAIEARSVATVFGDHARSLNISSTKSTTGHLLGAAGSLEAAFTALAIRNGVVPPTMNLDNVDPEITDLNLNLTPKRAENRDIEVAISNSFGFGGTNACLVLKKV